jgi:hypothetical protein
MSRLSIAEIQGRFFVLVDGELFVPIAFANKSQAQAFLFQQLILNNKGESNEKH